MLDRALGALAGMAVGDALGMPSQTLSREEIRRRYGRIGGFVAPYPGHPVSRGLSAGQVTDDTEQALLLARNLVDGNGRVDAARLARDLLEWEAGVRARGLLDLLGPSTRTAIDAILAGKPVDEAGREGTTNGAAMRIAPVGIATPPEPAGALVDRVEEACRATHNTGEAIAAAAAVAAAVSTGVAGGGFEAAADAALLAAREGQRRGNPAGEPDMAGRIAAALAAAGAGTGERADIGAFADAVGTSVASRESVAAAFGVVRLAGGDPWEAGLLAANIGDDTDTIGAIAGAIAGATAGAGAIPGEALEALAAANDLPLERTARELLGLRDSADARAERREGAP